MGAISLSLNIQINSSKSVSLDNRNYILKWQKATSHEIVLYRHSLDYKLKTIVIPLETIYCKDMSCKIHTELIDVYFNQLLNINITTGLECIPYSKPGINKSVIPF